MEETSNPFISIYLNAERCKKSYQGNRWDFYEVTEEGVKLNCKIIPSLYYRKRDGEWELMRNIVIIKDIAIDEARTKRGYFTRFIRFLLTRHNVIHLESVQPTWLIERLESPGSLWTKQSGTCYILLASDIKETIFS